MTARCGELIFGPELKIHAVLSSCARRLTSVWPTIRPERMKQSYTRFNERVAPFGNNRNASEPSVKMAIFSAISLVALPMVTERFVEACFGHPPNGRSVREL